jgi:hypothetical protein
MKITTVDPFPVSTPNVNLAGGSEPPMSLDPSQLAERAAALTAERRRLEEDSEALRLREANLREYEARLRAVQDEMDASQGGRAQSTAPFASRSVAPFPTRSMTPFPNDAALEAAWQKLHRAREITAAEQAHLRDDRIAMHAFEAELKEREAAVAAREARIAEIERNCAGSTPSSEPKREQTPTPPKTVSAFTRLTRAPFLMAENVLRGKKEDDQAKPSE